LGSYEFVKNNEDELIFIDSETILGRTDKSVAL